MYASLGENLETANYKGMGIESSLDLAFLFTTTQSADDMSKVWRTWKGRTARWCNVALQRRGAFWQRDWFDRWMRDAASIARTVDYIRNNPVKGGLVKEWKDYPWVR